MENINGLDVLFQELENLPLGGDPHSVITKINATLYQVSEDKVKEVFRPFIFKLALMIIRDHLRRLRKPIDKSDVVKVRQMLEGLENVDFSELKSER